MKNLFVTISIIAMFLLCGQAMALSIETVITTNVENRMPVDTVEAFAPGVERVYFWNKITEFEEETFIRHVWLYKGQELADVTLPIRGEGWRTYSYKSVLPEWIGSWEIKIVGADGNVIKSVSFTIGEKAIEAGTEEISPDATVVDTVQTTPADTTK